MGEMMNSDTRDQARAIREHHDKQPAPRSESARDARLRQAIERERKQRPMTGGTK